MEASPVGRSDDPATARFERYETRDGRLVRLIERRSGACAETDCGPAPGGPHTQAALHALADQRYLQLPERPQLKTPQGTVAVVDLFSGLGALSLGVMEAARAIGLGIDLTLAADSDPYPLKVYDESLTSGHAATRCVDLGKALAGRLAKPTAAERALLSDCPEEIDVLVAGPPCQGHSRLNNHTRHDDDRNDLYRCVARFVVLRQPRLVLVENVDSVVADERQSSYQVADQLRALGYQVDDGPILLSELGVAQSRRRHVLVGTRADQRPITIDDVLRRQSVAQPEIRTVSWAIGDLLDIETDSEYDKASVPNSLNRQRMHWLHEHDEYVLPNDQRPDCHRLPKRADDGSLREHSYRSMYGRLYWDRPAQTVTSGYGSMGQGRYVHPRRVRTLTPHEAARLQAIPDFVRVDAVQGRGRWARMIGNVAPMKLSYAFALEFLR